MKIKTSDYRVRPKEKVKLKEWPTQVDRYYRSKAHSEELLAQHIDELRKIQPKLYAHNRYALLIIFQALDAAGKDSAIKHVMSGINPQGCQVYSFKHPGPDVLAHDFLWNAARKFPERGHIGIFNRSYYEEVLIVRVHPELLHAERVPHNGASTWESRYKSIRGFERNLHESG